MAGAESLTQKVAAMSMELGNLLPRASSALTSQLQEVQEALAALKAGEEKLASRTQELASRESVLSARASECTAAEQANAQRARELESRAGELEAHAEQLAVREQKVEQREAQLASGEAQLAQQKSAAAPEPPNHAALARMPALTSAPVQAPTAAQALTIDPKALARATAAALIKMGV
uniref:Uncharacterized protein n=1 Tax=Haptolina ericina TaxID=156174 RepID=A0A7S3BB80_9EUKA